MNRLATYLGANLLFAGGAIAAVILRPETDVHPFYLILLFALCSSPLLDMTRWNNRYALLAVFAAFYFVMYGLLDTSHLIFGSAPTASAALDAGRGASISQPELLILAGGLLTLIGYRVGCLSTRTTTLWFDQDWTEGTLILVGGTLWAVSTWLSWRFKVYVAVDTSVEGINSGLSRIGQLQAMIYMIASYLQPLGIVFLAYAQCRYKRPYMIPLIAVAIAVEMLVGFISDVKGEVFLGLILIGLTKFMMDGTIPKARLLLLAALVVVLFPVLQANRVVRGEYDVNHTQAARNLVEVFKRALLESNAVNTGSERAATFFERTSLKSSVELIVGRTGFDVPFQNGYTLSPIVTTFIPRILWPDKPDVQTGRVMNEAFQISEVDATYISPSHLGELYWNYGWIGALLGMPLIGLLLGFVGAKCDLSRSVTLTRLLIVIVTIKLLILGSESALAPQYTMWLRSMVPIWLLHVLFARNAPAAVPDGSRVQSLRDAKTLFPVPNLMR